MELVHMIRGPSRVPQRGAGVRVEGHEALLPCELEDAQADTDATELTSRGTHRAQVKGKGPAEQRIHHRPQAYRVTTHQATIPN
eukprot:scaffold21436_cov28-Tisochrysis_lutea.AAC.4